MFRTILNQLVSLLGSFSVWGPITIWGIAALVCAGSPLVNKEVRRTVPWVTLGSIVIAVVLGMVENAAYLVPVPVLLSCAVGALAGSTRKVWDYIKLVALVLVFFYVSNGSWTLPQVSFASSYMNLRGVDDEIFTMSEVLKENEPGTIVCMESVSTQLLELAPAYAVLDEPVACTPDSETTELNSLLNDQGGPEPYLALALENDADYIVSYTAWNDTWYMTANGYVMIYESEGYRMYRRG